MCIIKTFLLYLFRVCITSFLKNKLRLLLTNVKNVHSITRADGRRQRESSTVYEEQKRHLCMGPNFDLPGVALQIRQESR
jgi:hypothetical protein